MPDELQLILAFAGALALVQLTVPMAIRLAVATGFLDHPAGYKQHGRSTPYLGGLALMAAVLPVALALGGGSDVVIILACAAGLCLVGTIDDRAHLGPGVRVLAEFAAAFALWQSDLGWLLWDGNLLDLALTTLWVVGLVNAFNLMDNLDGAAGTVGAVSAAEWACSPAAATTSHTACWSCSEPRRWSRSRSRALRPRCASSASWWPQA